jgi:hypothetical protein
VDVDQRKYLLIHAFSFPQFGCLNSLLAESKSCPISYAWLTLRFGVPKTGAPGAVTADDA